MEMSAILLNMGPGDEVILPSFTFVSTANAFLTRGARLKFVDNDRYGNIDLESCESAMTPKTKAVLAVHYGGNSADMDALTTLCRSRGVHLIEDAAQAIGSRFKARPLGTFGTLGCISFHDTKNITSGEGGALIVNDRTLLARAEIIREKGTNRSQFFQGLVDKYTWVDVGSSYVLSEMNAAYLWPQLQRLEEINARRMEIAERYREELEGPVKRAGARILENPKDNVPNGHLFAILLGSNQKRAKFIAAMKERSVLAPFHFVALHTSPMGAQFLSGSGEDLENCMQFSDCLVRLPIYFSLTEAEQDIVIQAVKEALVS